MTRFAEMARIGALPGGGVCRLSLTNGDKHARALLAKWMKALKLEVKVDQIGNMYGIRKGRSKGAAVAIGSHLDTVVTGGLYDGSYGVLVGLEVMATLNDNKVETERPVILINFTNEEGARFAPDMMGSLVVSKPELVPKILKARAFDGKATVGSELKRIGYAGRIKCGSVPIDHYLELHIEQGPILESEGLNIGIVERVQGIFWTEYILTGRAAHAGTTPLDQRKDAGLAAAEINQYMRKLSGEIPGQLCTLGFQEFQPNVVNVVPERVRIITDLRNPDYRNLISAQERLDKFIEEMRIREVVKVSREEKVRLAPVDFSTDVTAQIAMACKELGYSSRRMISGAGHDAQMMAAVSKAAMIFVPSKDGVSHNVKEYTAPTDLERGANVMLRTVVGLITS